LEFAFKKDFLLNAREASYSIFLQFPCKPFTAIQFGKLGEKKELDTLTLK